jgi:pyruvate-formate lyase-activating enzyme
VPKAPKRLPQLLVADANGKIMAHPGLKMCGRSGENLVPINPEELIPLPQGSDLFGLPGRTAYGYDEGSGDFVPVDEGPKGEEIRPLAAFMAPAHTGHYISAYRNREDAPRLPLFAYTAVGELDGEYYVAATRVDPDPRQDPERFDPQKVQSQIKAKLAAKPENRLVAHLANCATTNNCSAAKNFFLERFEAPIPSSPLCNSDCVGCLSFQKPEVGFPSTQQRISFVPTSAEIEDCILSHFEKVAAGVASFGQGCEGDSLMNPSLLIEAIRAVRAKTQSGTLNVNTNGSRPEAVRELMKAGLDAIRVSLNSAQEGPYNAYYRPRGYSFAQVKESIRTVAEMGGHASINYFCFPGFSDREAEIEALLRLIRETGLQLIQWRNLNLDPDLYLETLGDLERYGKALGIKTLLARVRQEFPKLRFGYYNPAWRAEAASGRAA